MSGSPWSPYWNPKNETLAKDDLRRLQLAKLQRSVSRAWHQSPFHRRLYEQAGVTPDRIETLDDLRRLPFMTREDWMASARRNSRSSVIWSPGHETRRSATT